MKPEVKKILDKVKETPDFGYVDFININATNELGDNALHCVAVWGDCEAAKVLIEAGIDINKHGEHGYTPLHQACSFGHKEFVKLLLDSGANTFARTEGDLPFTKARLAGCDDICNMIKPYMEKQKDNEEISNHEKHLEHLRSEIARLEKEIKEKCK